jgi:hypothetical protein
MKLQSLRFFCCVASGMIVSIHPAHSNDDVSFLRRVGDAVVQQTTRRLINDQTGEIVLRSILISASKANSMHGSIKHDF